MNYRCFIALEAPDEVRRDLEARLFAFRRQPGVNWVKEANLHLTLLFLGDVDSARIPELEQVLAKELRGLAAWPLRMRGLELFPARQPRLVWASLESQDRAVFDLHKSLLGAVRQSGIEPDPKPLKLHITLGRIKAQIPATLEREILQSEVNREFHAFGQVTLYRSVLKPEGPSYTVLNQYNLQ